MSPPAFRENGCMRFVLLTAATLLVCLTSLVSGQNVRFTSGSAVRDIPFRIANNLILVEASLNNAPKGWFIFDTGAESTVVESKYAASAGLRQSGKTTGTGSAGTAVAGVIKGATFNLSTLKASDLTVYELPLEAISVGLGVRIAGILGNDVIAGTVAEIDYPDLRLTLYSPAAFNSPSTAEVLPLTIEEHLPFVRASIDAAGRTTPAKLEIDTGSTGAVLFNSPFVRRHRLATSLGRSMGARTGGVGGTGTSRVARVNGIQLGKTLIKEPIATLYTGAKGDNASDSYDGLLGGAIFRRFKVTVDLTGRRLFLEATLALGQPFETDMSGFDLVADGDDLSKILVDEVKPASAAAKAGARGGELIRSINGRPASELGIQEVRRILKTPGQVDVELVRGRRVFTVHLVLVRVI